VNFSFLIITPSLFLFFPDDFFATTFFFYGDFFALVFPANPEPGDPDCLSCPLSPSFLKQVTRDSDIPQNFHLLFPAKVLLLGLINKRGRFLFSPLEGFGLFFFFSERYFDVCEMLFRELFFEVKRLHFYIFRFSTQPPRVGDILLGTPWSFSLYECNVYFQLEGCFSLLKPVF